jgi:hypothetical protein
MRSRPRCGEIIMTRELTLALRDAVARHGMPKDVITAANVSKRWFYKALNQRTKRLREDFLRRLCDVLRLQLRDYGVKEVPPAPHCESGYRWEMATDAHVEWMASPRQNLYELYQTLDLRLKWRRWNSLGYRAILLEGSQCGICELLSVKKSYLDRLSAGDMTEGQLCEEWMFGAWPDGNLLLQHLMILDPRDGLPTESPMAVHSLLTDLPEVLRRCGERGTTIYTRPYHTCDQSKKYPPRTARLLRRLPFQIVQPTKPSVYPYYKALLGDLLDALADLRQQMRF